MSAEMKARIQAMPKSEDKSTQLVYQAMSAEMKAYFQAMPKSEDK